MNKTLLIALALFACGGEMPEDSQEGTADPSSVSADDPVTSHQTSTRVEEVFTCCPPGPPDRDTRYSSSANGSRSSGLTTR